MPPNNMHPDKIHPNSPEQITREHCLADARERWSIKVRLPEYHAMFHLNVILECTKYTIVCPVYQAHCTRYRQSTWLGSDALVHKGTLFLVAFDKESPDLGSFPICTPSQHLKLLPSYSLGILVLRVFWVFQVLPAEQNQKSSDSKMPLIIPKLLVANRLCWSHLQTL